MYDDVQLAPLKKRSEFLNVYQGSKFFTACFSVHFTSPKHNKNKSPYVKYGITVSKKNCGNAVARNFIKRRIKESFRQFGASKKLHGYEIVFTALKRAPDKDWLDYVKAMRKLPELIYHYDTKN